MKRKLFTTLFAGLLLLGVGLMGSSCSSDDGIADINMETYFFDIPQSAWTWNNNAKQYEAIAEFRQLTPTIYERGDLNGYVFIGTKGKDEVQIPLPYVDAYQNPGISPYVESIRCDFQLANPSTVGFIIKTSDLQQHTEAIANYTFKVVVTWRN